MVAIVRPQAGAAGFVIRAKARKVGIPETGFFTLFYQDARNVLAPLLSAVPTAAAANCPLTTILST